MSRGDSRFSISALKKEKIRELYQLKPAYNWVILLFFGIWGVAGIFTLQMQNFWLKLPGYLLSGIVLHALGILMHEGVHSNLYRNQNRGSRWTNRWLGFLCGAPTLLAVSAYQAVHLPHHRYERGVEDPDELENITRHPPFLKIILLIAFTIGAYFYLFHILITGLKIANNRNRRNEIIQEYLLILLFLGLAIHWIPFRMLAQIWLIPLLFTAQLAQVRGWAEHIFTAGEDTITASRTVTSNRLVSFFMCNLNYHLEHHLYPGVPWYNLPKLHHLLLEDFRRAGASIYSSYIRYIWDVFKVLVSKVPNPDPLPKPTPRYFRHAMSVLPAAKDNSKK